MEVIPLFSFENPITPKILTQGKISIKLDYKLL